MPLRTYGLIGDGGDTVMTILLSPDCVSACGLVLGNAVTLHCFLRCRGKLEAKKKLGQSGHINDFFDEGGNYHAVGT